jgi:hemolysin activation/secretion protein
MVSRSCIRFLAFTVYLAMGVPCHAQALQDPSDRLLRERQAREREQRLEQTTPEIAAPKAGATETGVHPEQIPDPEPTFLIERISIGGANLLPAAETERIVSPFIGIRLGANRINLLLKRLSQAFIEHGYVTTRAYVGSQNLASGTLEIAVIPGRIEKLVYNGEELAPERWNEPGLRAALPAAQGELLKLSDLEQGIEQLNRLRRNRAEAQIFPGQTPGGSVVTIRNQSSDPFYYSLGADNYGSEATGQNRTRASVEANNLLGLQEALSLSFVGSLDANALLFAGSVPLGYNTFSYTYARSEFQNLVGDVALVFGQTRGHTLAWNRVLARGQAARAGLDASLGLRDATREVNNIELSPQNLAVARIGLNRLHRFGLVPGYWTVDLGYARGVSAFGAARDVSDLPRDAAHAQFDKLDLTASLGAQLGPPALSYRAALGGQWAQEALFSSEQIFAGGAGTVRGFSESAVSGDRGFLLRQELAYGEVPALWEGRVRVEPFAFLDAARTELIAEGKWNQLAGAGLGVRASIWNISTEIAAAQPITASDAVEKKFRVHATLNLSF